MGTPRLKEDLAYNSDFSTAASRPERLIRGSDDLCKNVSSFRGQTNSVLEFRVADRQHLPQDKLPPDDMPPGFRLAGSPSPWTVRQTLVAGNLFPEKRFRHATTAMRASWTHSARAAALELQQGKPVATCAPLRLLRPVVDFVSGIPW